MDSLESEEAASCHQITGRDTRCVHFSMAISFNKKQSDTLFLWLLLNLAFFDRGWPISTTETDRLDGFSLQ